MSRITIFGLWNLIKEVEELKVYFPDLDENQLPNCEYMYSVLSTLRNDKVNSMVLKVRKNRSIDSKENNLVYIWNEIYEEKNNNDTKVLAK